MEVKNGSLNSSYFSNIAIVHFHDYGGKSIVRDSSHQNEKLKIIRLELFVQSHSPLGSSGSTRSFDVNIKLAKSKQVLITLYVSHITHTSGFAILHLENGLSFPYDSSF